MLGLARLAEYLLGETGQKQEMQLIDEGVRYRLQLNQPAALEKFQNLEYCFL